MAQILVRKIPDDVMKDIRRAAAAGGLSVEEYARRVLAQQADHTNRWREFLQWSREFRRSQRKGGHNLPSTTELIRSDRER